MIASYNVYRWKNVLMITDYHTPNLEMLPHPKVHLACVLMYRKREQTNALREALRKTRTTNVVRNTRCAGSRYTLKLSLNFFKSMN